MNVLSLFDGISAGQLALERAGIKVDKYFASEIDKYAISEMEALQTFPIGYTDSISENQARKSLGNSWTVDVIAHILGGINE